MKFTGFFSFLFIATLALSMNPLYAASPAGPYNYSNRTYYIVNASDPNLNTGTAVCRAVGLQCVGYTDFNTKVCQMAHPGASSILSVNGSKAGYYCNGPSQPGECSTKYNTCDVCTACNVNANCNSTIGGAGDNFQEMYVQCAVNASAALQQFNATQTATTTIPLSNGISNYNQHPSIFSSFFSFFANIFSSFFHSIFSGFSHTTTTTKNTTVLIGPYPGYWGCTFFQTPWQGVNQKKASCNAYKAGDTFCATVLQSQYATAAYCNDTSGLIVCINPCNKGGQVVPTSCPYDAARPNGAQAPPQNWC